MRLIRSSFLMIVLVLLCFNSIFAQAFDRPESAVYDAVNDRYLISNTGNGDIISVPRLNPGNLSFFSTGQMSSVRGIIIVDNTLWTACTSNDGTSQMLYGYDLNTGVRISGSIWITEGNFINDVTAGENDIVYLSDNNNIYWINTVSGAYGTLLANAGANGLLYDGANNRLLFTDDRPATGSAISAIDLTTNNVTTLITNPGFQWLDGLTVDHLGNYYVSCWSAPNAVYRYDPNFTSSVLASSGHNNVDHDGVADIFYDKVNDILVAPNMSVNTVDFIPFSQLSATDEVIVIPEEFQMHQNFPNPFNPNTTIFYDVNKESNVKISVFDLLGREIVTLINQIEQAGSKSINWDGRDYTGNMVNAGVYIYQIEAEGFIQTKKMVLLK